MRMPHVADYMQRQQHREVYAHDILTLNEGAAAHVAHASGDPAGGDPVGGDPAGGDPAGGDPAGGDPAGGDPAQKSSCPPWLLPVALQVRGPCPPHMCRISVSRISVVQLAAEPCSDLPNRHLQPISVWLKLPCMYRAYQAGERGPEVSNLQTEASAIFHAVRCGFAQARFGICQG